MNPFEMVVAIIVVVTIGSIIRARFGVRDERWGSRRHRHGPGPGHDDPAVQAENDRLREEVRSLKERVQVLERVITDNEGSLRLDREIERLRDSDNRV